jgi:hypothetical protein
MRHRPELGLLFIFAIGLTSPAFAATTVYHCLVNGQTVLTDRPCDSPAAAVVSPDGSKSITATPTVVGAWRGQGQFQGTENGQLIADAHTVVPVVMSFTADGKVTGSSPENGCEPLGLWYAGVTPRLFTLDITLKNCRYSGFNRRYSGSFLATFPTNSGELALQAYTMPIPAQPTRRYDVGATLRR